MEGLKRDNSTIKLRNFFHFSQNRIKISKKPKLPFSWGCIFELILCIYSIVKPGISKKKRESFDLIKLYFKPIPSIKYGNI